MFEVGTLDGAVFLAMEYIEGTTLKQWMAERRPWRAVLATFAAAGRRLAAAHAVGIVHRDFKPENVLVGDDGRVRVGDFGLASARAGNRLSQSTAAVAPQARTLYRRAVAVGDKRLGAHHPRTPGGALFPGRSELGAGDPVAAVAALERSVAGHVTPGSRAPPGQLPSVRVALADALWRADRSGDRARPRAEVKADARELPPPGGPGTQQRRGVGCHPPRARQGVPLNGVSQVDTR